MFFRRKKEKKTRRQRAAQTFHAAVGTETHKAALDIISMPGKVRQRRNSGDDPKMLKSLTFQELLQCWAIPAAKVGYLKKVLTFEIIALFIPLCLALWGIADGLHKGSTIQIVGGVVFGGIILMGMAHRLHWLYILKLQKYLTFKDFITGAWEENE